LVQPASRQYDQKPQWIVEIGSRLGETSERYENRKEASTDHLPNVSFADNAAKAKGTGPGKDKNGDPQVCFAWRNNAVCPKKSAGTCQYAHPMDAKGKGKPGGDKGGKGGKQQRSSSTSSRGGKKGGAGGGKGAPSPGGKVVIDPALLRKNYLKGKCDKGKACKFHHNGPCVFHNKGSCNKGDACIFSRRHAPGGAPAMPVVAPFLKPLPRRLRWKPESTLEVSARVVLSMRKRGVITRLRSPHHTSQRPRHHTEQWKESNCK